MSDIAVRAKDLVKIYRLYKSPGDRVLDVLGLLRGGAADGRWREHRALDGISFDIRKGEKVAIIGRNGAGKSTLLKLITKTIEPSSGSLDVEGATQPLLQIGTGFHPDFTGRDNVVSYLAQLGIAGAKAERLTRDIIEFAEVEEYIDQPVKTYSSGMGARLMFAASTVIEPDVLVIDEVLGVGDAYFARKSYERIRTLCAEHNSTLLLVSHDIYSASQIADRMIWIDRGRIKFDGSPKAAINLYEASIKEQEEQRLRRKATLVPGFRPGAGAGRQVLVEIRTPDGRPMTGVLFFYEAALADGVETLARVDPVAGTSDAETAKVTGNGLELVYEASNWLTTEEAGRQDGIVLANYGQPYHKGTLRAELRGGLEAPALVLSIESASDQRVAAVVYDGEQRGFQGGEITLKAGHRTEWRVGLDTGALERVSDLAQEATGAEESRHGTGRLEIVSVRFHDAEGRDRSFWRTGDHLRVTLGYRLNDPTFDERPVLVVAFQRDGTLRTHRFWHDGIALSAGIRNAGEITVETDHLLLGAGRYFITVSAFKQGYFDSIDATRFFSTSNGLYDMRSRSFELVVEEDKDCTFFNDAIFSHPCRWSMDGTAFAAPEHIRAKDLWS